MGIEGVDSNPAMVIRGGVGSILIELQYSTEAMVGANIF